ncbi:MAG TPA: glycosyltransferase family 9 protein [bacterium]|nr:glycosyltransferase family 9 protein [bacterium]
MSDSPSRILIVRLSAIGDVIHALPCLHALRAAFPKAHIGWVVEEFAAPLLERMSGLDQLHCLSRGGSKTFRKSGSSKPFLSLVKEVRQAHYDVSVDLQGLTKSAVWGLLSGARMRIGYGDKDGRELSRLLNNRRIVPQANVRHVVDRNLSLLSALGINNPTVRFDLPVHQESAGWARRLMADAGLKPPCVVTHPGAGWQTKRWSPKRYAEVCHRLHDDFGFSVILSTGPREESLCHDFLESLGSVPSAAPAMDQLQLQETIRAADLFIGPDTGPMHLAVALGKPTVAIFGGSDPIRNGPYGSKNLVLTTALSCQPCWRTQCPAVRCLEELTVDEVYPAVKEYWLRCL